MLALRDAKNDYDRHYRWYAEKMLQKVRSEQEYFVNMRRALENGEFCPWQHLHSSHER